MTSDSAAPTAAQRRKFGMLLVGIAVALSAIVIGFTLATGRVWLLFGLAFVIPNVVKAVSEFRAAGREQL